LTLQCNSYLSHVRSFFKISSNFLKMPAPLFFQNNLTFVIQMLINVFPRIFFVRTFFLHISRESNNIYCFWYIEYVLDETYKFNLQSSIFNKIYNFNRSIQIYLSKNNIYCYFHDLCAKKMLEQKRFAGRHLLTFESQKLN
jgi:hypothetical protein